MPPEDDGSTDDNDTSTTDTDADNAGDGDDDLGAGGLEALRAERRARRDAERDARSAADALTQAQADGLEALEQARSEGRAEAEAAAVQRLNGRIVEAEIKAAASGKLRRPEYAVRLLDTSKFTVADDGTVDTDAITSAIDALVTSDPELAATGAPGPLPGGGARPTTGTSIDDQIRARARGR